MSEKEHDYRTVTFVTAELGSRDTGSLLPGLLHLYFRRLLAIFPISGILAVSGSALSRVFLLLYQVYLGEEMHYELPSFFMSSFSWIETS